jgi:hypothetical protein
MTAMTDRMLPLDDTAVRALTILKLMDRQEELKARIDAAIETLSPNETALLIRLMKQRRRDGGGDNG